MPAPLIAREEVVRRLLTVFRSRGFDGASLAELSKASGLGKSSLYHYFPGGKEDMARAVLDEVASWMRQHVLEPLVASGPPVRRLSRMIAALDDLYDCGRAACLLGNMLVGDSQRLFQTPLKAAFNEWIAALATLARDAGQPPARARVGRGGGAVDRGRADAVARSRGSRALPSRAAPPAAHAGAIVRFV